MKPLLIIDPGHGGNDSGGGSNAQFTEKAMVLQISLYQYRRFQELGVPVAITRDKDITLSSSQRSQIVRNSGARYCISNHINAGGGRGAEAIYSIYASDALAKTLLRHLGEAGMPIRRAYTRTLPNNPKQDYYFMHRETGAVETIILEYGFADNPADAQKIASDWRLLAEAVVRAFCEHVGHKYVAPDSGVTPAPPASGPAWKVEAVDWLFAEGLLTDQSWRNRLDEPLPLWAEAIILRRLYDKLRK